MNVFALGDPHLSGEPPSKPMYIFGEHWRGHWEKLKADWEKKVTDEDAVLLVGDISWAMKWQDALVDLEAIAALPGQKYLIRGNHDYWWQTIGKMQRLAPPSLHFMQNNFYELPEKNLALCGTRGWMLPQDPNFKEADQAIFDREVLRLDASLAAARKSGNSQMIVLLHYPPLFSPTDQNKILDLIDTYEVTHCLYGHLHDQSVKGAFQGKRNETTYHLVSCDSLNFTLKQI
ncbi:MAG: metallophosphoesterase [Sporomusaceae bacterium]|nr:metallophosphoesterase [Sporomusaceae bacterium]